MFFWVEGPGGPETWQPMDKKLCLQCLIHHRPNEQRSLSVSQGKTLFQVTCYLAHLKMSLLYPTHLSCLPGHYCSQILTFLAAFCLPHGNPFLFYAPQQNVLSIDSWLNGCHQLATNVRFISMSLLIGAVVLAFISSNEPSLTFKCIYIILTYVYIKDRFSQVFCDFFTRMLIIFQCWNIYYCPPWLLNFILVVELILDLF